MGKPPTRMPDIEALPVSGRGRPTFKLSLAFTSPISTGWSSGPSGTVTGRVASPIVARRGPQVLLSEGKFTGIFNS